jgi:hypothetical protein
MDHAVNVSGGRFDRRQSSDVLGARHRGGTSVRLAKVKRYYDVTRLLESPVEGPSEDATAPGEQDVKSFISFSLAHVVAPERWSPTVLSS